MDLINGLPDLVADLAFLDVFRPLLEMDVDEGEVNRPCCEDFADLDEPEAEGDSDDADQFDIAVEAIVFQEEREEQNSDDEELNSSEGDDSSEGDASSSGYEADGESSEDGDWQLA